MKQPSALNSLGSVLASQAASQAKNTAPSAESAQPFGDLLSREMENRHNASRAEAPAGDAAANTRSSTGQPRQAASQDANREAAGVRNRQEAQRSQERRDAEHRQDDRAAASASAAAADSGSADAANKTNTVTSASNSAGATAAAPADKASEADDGKSAATDAATVAAQAGAPVSSAAAALQALVASMAPKTTAPAAGTADIAIDSKPGATRSPATVAGGTANATADEALPHDPAFDALLAQATQLSQARDGGKQAITGRALPAGAELQNGAAQGGGAAFEHLAGMLPAAATSAKGEASLGAAALPTALLRTDADAVAALPGASAALGTGILQATGAAAAAGTDTLSPRVGTPAWDHALGQKVVWMAAGAEQSASLTLNPPDLGPVQVVINVSNSQADASFTAAQPEVRQALEAALPKLREMLADAGISLGQTSVGAGSPNQQGAADRQQAAGSARRSGSATPSGEEAVAGIAQPTGRRAASSGNGLVNTFA